MPRQTYPCPKCGRTLQQEGELSVGGVTLPAFQCEDCVVMIDLGGEQIDLPLTFVLGPDGQPFDPAEPDGRVRF